MLYEKLIDGKLKGTKSLQKTIVSQLCVKTFNSIKSINFYSGMNK